MITREDCWPYCRVCGWVGSFFPGSPIANRSNSAGWRCERHRMRNPCAIEGCKRSTSASPGWHGLSLWLCSEHWRAGVPPRSLERRVYHRIFRLAKRYGWDDQLRARYWRVWARLVALARARCSGDLDEREIKRLFGWD